MMRFVNDEPVWPTGFDSKLKQIHQQALEECWPLIERNANHVNNAVGFRLLQHVDDFLLGWGSLHRAKDDSLGETFIVTLGIDDTILIFMLDEPLKEGRCQRSFSSAGSAREHNADPVRGKPNGCRCRIGPYREIVAYKPWSDFLEIAIQ